MSGIVVEVITPDSSVSDPDESPGAPMGGRMLRHSMGTADRLRAADLVEEYRLLTLPTVLGTAGRRIFPAGGRPADLDLDLLDVALIVPDVLTRYWRATR